jgi:3',5'-cyclic AMP phosphodiesterase CpdA
MIRVLQISDTHLSHRRSYGIENVWRTIEYINDDPPELVIHTGDIVSDDPDDADERRFAYDVLSAIDAPLAVLPGNHDVGGFTGVPFTEERNTRFIDLWGSDTFSTTIGRWRLIGANVYRLGEQAHDEWLAEQMTAEAHVALYLHQPPFMVARDVVDEGDWSLAMPLRARLEALGATRAALTAAGHVHRFRELPGVICCPSASFIAAPADDGSQYLVGCVEHLLFDYGRTRSRLVIPPGTEPLFYADLAANGERSLGELPERPVPTS